MDPFILTAAINIVIVIAMAAACGANVYFATGKSASWGAAAFSAILAICYAILAVAISIPHHVVVQMPS